MSRAEAMVQGAREGGLVSGIHYGTNGTAWGVWGVDARGHVTFVETGWIAAL
jgi:hypothetical protein